jgi:PAS domain S-box-containing protein
MTDAHQPPRVLIIEDEIIIASDLEARLERFGYRVCGTGTTGEEAVELADRHRPDLVLMDIVLSGELDGIEAAEVIRDRWGVPVVFITAYADTGRLERAKLAYPFGYVLKPFQDRDLKITLSMALYVGQVEARRRATEEELKKYRQIVSSTREGVSYVDAEYRYQIVNDAYERFAAVDKSELIGRTISEYLGAEAFEERVKPQFDRCLQGETLSYQEWFDYPTLGRRFVEVHYYPYIDSDGRIDGVVANTRDITDWKLADDARRENELKYRSAIDLSPLGFGIADPDGLVLDCNQALADLVGYSVEDLIGRNFASFTHPDDLEREWELIDGLWRGDDCSYTVEKRYIRADGGVVWVQVVASLTRDQWGQKRLGFAFVEDITERRRREAELRESENKYRTIFENSPLGLFRSTPEGRFIEVNPALAEMLGYDSPQAVLDQVHSIAEQIYVRSEDRPAIVEKNLEVNGMTKHLNRYRRADGSEFLANLFLKTVRDDQGRPLYLEGIVQDVTANIELENALMASEERFRQMADLLPVPLAEYGFDLRPIYLNQAAYQWFGYTEEEVAEGLSVMEAVPEEHRETIERRLEALKTGGRLEPFELFLKKKDGSRMYARVIVAPLLQGGEVIGARTCLMDLTERKRHEDLLSEALAEKEVLLREVHHRVKNNMQVVNSLLNLQAAKLEDEQSRQAIRECQNRVASMALVHELIHRSDAVGRLDLAAYVRRLVENTIESYRWTDKKVTADIAVPPDVFMNIDQAIPCGLIVNELLGNSIKHGFERVEEGRFEVRVERTEGDWVRLVVSDNGEGLPEGLDWRRGGQTLGLSLVARLAEGQLGGTVEASAGPGAVFRIAFPLR